MRNPECGMQILLHGFTIKGNSADSAIRSKYKEVRQTAFIQRVCNIFSWDRSGCPAIRRNPRPR